MTPHTVKRRDGNPDNKHNWALTCGACGQRWYDAETVELTEGHFQQEHPDLEHPNFYLTWVGIGPKPKRGTHSRAPRPRRR